MRVLRDPASWVWWIERCRSAGLHRSLIERTADRGRGLWGLSAGGTRGGDGNAGSRRRAGWAAIHRRRLGFPASAGSVLTSVSALQNPDPDRPARAERYYSQGLLNSSCVTFSLFLAIASRLIATRSAGCRRRSWHAMHRSSEAFDLIRDTLFHDCDGADAGRLPAPQKGGSARVPH